MGGGRTHGGAVRGGEGGREGKRGEDPTVEALGGGELVGEAEETLPTEAGKNVRLTPGGGSRLP